MARNNKDNQDKEFIGSWRRALLGGTALISSVALSGQALAQDQDAAAAEDEEQVEEVIVTGSRIRRSDFSSTNPMDIVSADEAAVQGYSDISSLLRSSTVAAGSPQVTAATSTAYVENGGAGVETLSLRGLGANRTLVLLNGRRAGPAGIRGSVSSFDFNVIPLAAIERVEILKDGASSVYGSDAVAGVVNIITKKESGGTLDSFVSIPQQSGGEEFRINGSYGAVFDRGNFRVTADYYRREELAKGDRDYFACGENRITDPETGERVDLVDPRTGQYRCSDWAWGHVWTYDYAEYFADGTTNLFPDTGGVLYQYDYSGVLGTLLTSPNDTADPANPYHMRTPDGWYQVGQDRVSAGLLDFDHPFQDQETLLPKTERFTVLAEGEYELTDNITMYAEAMFNRRETYENHYAQYWSYIYNDNFQFDNFDVVPDSGGPVADGWTGAQWFSPTPVADNFDSSTSVDYMRVVGGLKGSFGDTLPGWEFDTSFQFSKSDADYWSQFIFDDAVQSNNWGYGSCVGSTFNRIDADGVDHGTIDCIDVPWLDPELMRGNLTPELQDYLFGEETGHTIYEQYSFEASMNGDLFDMPAGTVAAAFGVHYRHDSLLDTPGEWSRGAFDADGLPIVDENGNQWGDEIWGGGRASVTEGSHNTKAAFAEFDIPLLADMPLVEMLSLNASVRYTDVSSYGDGITYKFGLNWQLTPEFRVRATRGTSFRTPALFELFLKDESAFISQRGLDPCYRWGSGVASGAITQRQADNCAADGVPADSAPSISGEVVTGGGFGVLDAETSTSYNVGFVWAPAFADLQLSVDYFRIEIRDEVAQLGGRNILFECYDSVDFPTDPLCDLFDRTPQGQPLPGAVTQVRDSYINIATQQNRGLDVSATYRTELPKGISLRVDTQHTFQFKDATELFVGFPDDPSGRAGDPKWVGNLIFTFEKGPWAATWGMRAVGGTSNVEDNGGDTVTLFDTLPDEQLVRIDIEAEAIVYHNVSVSHDFGNGFSAILGVSNLFDKRPPAASNIGWNGQVLGGALFYSQYDWEGRRFFLNLTKNF